MKFEWHEIYFSDNKYEVMTCRAKVKGGWIVKNCSRNKGGCHETISETMIFIADPNHEWSIEDGII